MRVIKPQRLSLLQRAFQVRGERLLAVGITAYVPLEAPEMLLPEISMWQQVPKELGKDVMLDECLPKPRGEVLAFGKAFAPGGKERPAFQVRVQVGPVDKTIYVVGKRRWVRGVPSDPEPLAELVLGWDKAFGGEGFAPNPAGMGLSPVEEDGQKVHYLPQLEDPKHLIKSPNDRPAPAVLGPLDPTSKLRQSKLGTYDSKWLEQDFPGLARDLDPEFFMLAPEDQRLPDFFRGGEPIFIENLHVEEPKLSSHVPQLVARCFVTRKSDGESFEDIPTRLDTVVLLPNIRRMIVIFRGIARVEEDDAADVTCLLAAFERADAARTIDHYRVILAQRLDKKKGHLVALRDRDLLPDADPDAPALPDEKFSDMEDLLQREGVMERRAHARAQRELMEVRRSAHVLGVDPDEKGIPREVPPPEAPPKLDELADYMERVEDEVARLEADAKGKQEEALAQARQDLAEHGVDLDEAIARAQEEGGGPPKFRAEAHLAQMRDVARIGRELGAPMEELEAQIDDPAFVAKLYDTERMQLTVYRMTAHHLPPAKRLEEPARTELRERVETALAQGTAMIGWDLTGADLRGLDLSRAVLKEALLEVADLRECNLSGANLEGAVLARANLEGARLQGANLAGANLGEVHAKGADFEGARLARAVFYRGELGGARFARADLSGADMFEARLDNADLQGIKADEVLFFEAHLNGAKLDSASLRKAIFFKCRMAGASFVEAVLDSAGLVEVQAQGACFQGAHANNLRLVLSCELTEANFSGAELALATLRGASFGHVNFTGIRADGCDMSESNLEEACLQRASLQGARFVRSDLRKADLTGANLMEAMLQNAKLHGASFQKANLFRATLMGAEGDLETSFQDAHVARTVFSRHKR